MHGVSGDRCGGVGPWRCTVHRMPLSGRPGGRRGRDARRVAAAVAGGAGPTAIHPVRARCRARRDRPAAASSGGLRSGGLPGGPREDVLQAPAVPSPTRGAPHRNRGDDEARGEQGNQGEQRGVSHGRISCGSGVGEDAAFEVHEDSTRPRPGLSRDGDASRNHRAAPPSGNILRKTTLSRRESDGRRAGQGGRRRGRWCRGRRATNDPPPRLAVLDFPAMEVIDHRAGRLAGALPPDPPVWPGSL
jgi:hypothetical protein